MALMHIAFGMEELPFTGWNPVKEKSPNIIIARCIKSVDDPNKASRSLIYSDIEVTTVLKGGAGLGRAQLGSLYWPRPGEQYFIFSIFHDGIYQANETYRIVPLGTYVPPDLLPGKKLDEQIQSLFQWRLNKLNRQMGEEQEEKQRLEDGLKK